MPKTNKTEEYAMAVVDSIMSIFRDKEDNGNQVYHYDLDKIDATEFFTGMVIGCCHVFNKFTGDDKNLIEFTHLCNQLIVQYLFEANVELVED